MIPSDPTGFELELQPRGTSGAAAAKRNGARAYLADSCDGSYNPESYAAIPLLGKTLSFEVDLSAVHCGCNAAAYLVSMQQNTEAGSCDGDYYCDANQVCGVRCAEIDLIEANKFALKTTAHHATDGAGKGCAI